MPDPSIQQVTIAPLAAEHAAAAAQLHVAGQPGTFLTSLGPRVLTVLYDALPRSSAGFGFAATSHQPPATSHQPVLGFISATTSVGRLFAEMGTRRAGQLLPALLARYRQEPTLALRSLQTAAYPFLVQQPGVSTDAHPAELLSIMVEPTARGHGIGGQLLASLVQTCQERGITLLDVTVAADNAGAQRFYARHGFVFQREFSLYGRPMCLYQLRLTDFSTTPPAAEPTCEERQSA
jgi:ribosomal protein S18 acetylase RimI-like enzyme